MPTVAELEAEVAATRSRLNDTIDQIQDKLTVSGLVDEFVGQAALPRMTSGHDLVLDLLRRHPVPVMVAAAGLGFLIYRMNKTANVVDVTALNDGHNRVYDPDQPTLHPRLEPGEGRIEA